MNAPPSALRGPGEASDLESHLRSLAQGVLERMDAAIRDRGRMGVETKHGPQDLVTTADRALEAWLFEVTSHAYPRDGFLGEERGWRRGPTGRRDWIIDPIDGTTNFVSGLPWSCCSVALLEGGEPVAGLVAESSRHDVYLTAGRDRPSELNGKRTEVAGDPSLAGKLVLLELPADAPPGTLEAVEVEVRRRGGGVRVMGAAALALAAVAAGQAHAAVLAAPSAWDVAAGVALVRHAGGVVLGLEGGYQLEAGGPVIAGCAAVSAQLQEATRRCALEALASSSLPVAATTDTPMKES